MATGLYGSVIYEATVKKKSRSGRWTSRYYVLTGDLIAYSKGKGQSPTGVFPLHTFHFASALEGGRWDLLVSGYGGKTSTFQLLSPSEEISKTWVNEVRRAAVLYEAGHPHRKATQLRDKNFIGKFWRNADRMLLLVKYDGSAQKQVSVTSPKHSQSVFNLLGDSNKRQAVRAGTLDERPAVLMSVTGDQPHHKPASASISGADMSFDQLLERSPSPSLETSPHQSRNASPWHADSRSTAVSQTQKPFSFAVSEAAPSERSLKSEAHSNPNDPSHGQFSPPTSPNANTNPSPSSFFLGAGEPAPPALYSQPRASAFVRNLYTPDGPNSLDRRASAMEGMLGTPPGLQRMESGRQDARVRGRLHVAGILNVKPLSESNLFVGTKRWQRRYFALYDEVLIYYKKKGDDPAGTIPLTLIRHVKRETNLKTCTRFVLSIDSTLAITTFLLMTKTTLECEQWVTSIGVQKEMMTNEIAQRASGSPPTVMRAPSRQGLSRAATLELGLIGDRLSPIISPRTPRTPRTPREDSMEASFQLSIEGVAISQPDFAQNEEEQDDDTKRAKDNELSEVKEENDPNDVTIETAAQAQAQAKSLSPATADATVNSQAEANVLATATATATVTAAVIAIATEPLVTEPVVTEPVITEPIATEVPATATATVTIIDTTTTTVISTNNEERGVEDEKRGEEVVQVKEVSEAVDAVKKSPFKCFAALSEKGFILDMEKENQDFQVAVSNFRNRPDKAVFMVLDGHGPFGHLVAEFVSRTVVELLAADPILETKPYKAITRAFHRANDKLIRESGINVSFSGTTCILCYLHGDTLYSCNTGDSRAVLAKRMDVWECSAVALSCDHKPARPDEKKRIVDRGGRVEPKKGVQGDIGSSRVWLQNEDIPGLAVSRAFGDALAASVGVVSTPEIWHRTVTTNDAFIILATDGVWEFITGEEAVEIVAQAESPEEGAAHLIEEAKKRWAEEDWEARDDITCQVVFF